MIDDWITVGPGLPYAMVRPNQATIMPSWVASSLAQINRFTGHALRPYSVAEHSLLVADIAERELGLDVHGVLWALLHDAHESVTGDLHTPGKRAVGPAWKAFEHHHEATFITAFAMHTASAQHGAAVKQADLIALATERRDLLAHNGPASDLPWACLRDVEPLARGQLMTTARQQAPWTFWRDAWLERYHALEWKRNEVLFALREGTASEGGTHA